MTPMKSSEVERILEYKKHNDVDYVLVEWKNKSKSWAKISNLSCKEIVCSFFRNALKILKEEEQANIEEERKKREQILLNKMINNNLKEAVRIEERQAKILSEFIDPLDKKSKEDIPFKDVRKMQQLISNPFKANTSDSKVFQNRAEIYKSPLPSAKSSYQSIHKPLYPERKRQEFTKVKQNNLLLKINDTVTLNLVFYMNNRDPSVLINSENIVFCKTRQIIPHIYPQYMKQDDSLKILPVFHQEDKNETYLHERVRNDRNSIVCRLNDAFWIISLSSTFSNILGIELKTEYVIFRTEKSHCLSDLFEVSNFIQPESLWVEKTFKYGASLMTDFIHSKCKISYFKNVFICGDKKLPLLSHFCKIIKRNGQVVDKITDSDTVIVYESYLDFIHFVPGFYESLRNHTKFFLVKNLQFEEILPYGGIITFTKDFIETAELISVAELVESITRKKNWYIKVNSHIYTTLKKRLSSQNTLPEYLHKMKTVYKAFKENIVEFDGENFRDHLEMSNYKTHRYFLEISTSKIDCNTISIEEAIKLVLSG